MTITVADLAGGKSKGSMEPPFLVELSKGAKINRKSS